MRGEKVRKQDEGRVNNRQKKRKQGKDIRREDKNGGRSKEGRRGDKMR